MPDKADDRARWRVEPGTELDLAAWPTSSTQGAPKGGKGAAEAAFPALWERLHELQERLYAESGQALLVVLQATDAGGKDGTIEHVFRGMNPQGVHVASFKAPTPDELAHDFLWRVHKEVPRKGLVGVFNRSHYEDVLIVRVRDLVPEETWRQRFGHIRDFEQTLAESGTTIVKLMLHISKEEQRERLQARLDDPAKHWKFNPADLEERERWDDYQTAFEEAIAETSTADAPWYVIPADKKWYRNWIVLRILVETLEAMDPQFPPPAEGLDGITID
jgi:PPK2 family polyphosphate:nucleotide phosphotransferase